MSSARDGVRQQFSELRGEMPSWFKDGYVVGRLKITRGETSRVAEWVVGKDAGKKRTSRVGQVTKLTGSWKAVRKVRRHGIASIVLPLKLTSW